MAAQDYPKVYGNINIVQIGGKSVIIKMAGWPSGLRRRIQVSPLSRSTSENPDLERGARSNRASVNFYQIQQPVS